MTSDKKTQSKNTIKKDIERLEEIASIMEEEDYDIDKALKLYEEGAVIRHSCISRLKDACLKIKEIDDQYNVKDIDIEHLMKRESE